MSRHIERGIRHENKPTNDGGRRPSNGRGNVWQHLVIMSIIRSVCQRAQRSLMRGRTVASCAWQRGRGKDGASGSEWAVGVVWTTNQSENGSAVMCVCLCLAVVAVFCEIFI